MNDMFGSKKEEDRIAEIDVSPVNVFSANIKTEQGEETVFPVFTNVNEPELKTLLEDYTTQKGVFDTRFRNYIEENGYHYHELQLQVRGPMVTAVNSMFIYKKSV